MAPNASRPGGESNDCFVELLRGIANKASWPLLGRTAMFLANGLESVLRFNRPKENTFPPAPTWYQEWQLPANYVTFDLAAECPALDQIREHDRVERLKGILESPATIDLSAIRKARG